VPVPGPRPHPEKIKSSMLCPHFLADLEKSSGIMEQTISSFIYKCQIAAQLRRYLIIEKKRVHSQPVYAHFSGVRAYTSWPIGCVVCRHNPQKHSTPYSPTAHFCPLYHWYKIHKRLPNVICDFFKQAFQKIIVWKNEIIHVDENQISETQTQSSSFCTKPQKVGKWNF
jgi:hypothetical protein